MTTNTDQPATHGETTLKAHLRQEIQAGMAAARDPENAGLPDLWARKTTIYSPWYTRTCPECKQKFREGDQVRLCPKCGQVFHDDDQYVLHCWKTRFDRDGVCQKPRYDPIAEVKRPGCDYCWPGTFPDTEGHAGEKKLPVQGVGDRKVEDQFRRGLDNVWSPYGGEKVLKVPEDAPIVGHQCPWCRFQFRAGDRAVKCPCGKCNTYLHDDIFRHLTCWNEWNKSDKKEYCPTTGARIQRLTEGEDER